MHNKSQKVSYLFLVLPFTFLLSSCGEKFKSINDFVDNHKDNLQKTSSAFADDIYQSCLRRINYIALTSPGAIGKNGIRAQTIADCDFTNRPAVTKVKAANSILLNYIAKLGEVASGKTVSDGETVNFASFGENINLLGEAIKDLNIPTSSGQFFQFPAPIVDAGTSILQVIANVFTGEERKRSLKKAILCSDNPLHIYITGNSTPKTSEEEKKPPKLNGGLIGMVQEGYINGVLETEKLQINIYYQTYFDQLRATNGAQVVGNLIAEKDYNQAMNIVRERGFAAQNYIAILQATADAHHQLQKEFLGTGKERITEAELSQLCQSVVDGKKASLSQDFQLKKLDLSEQQLRNTQKIVSKYVHTVEPLIKKIDKVF